MVEAGSEFATDCLFHTVFYYRLEGSFDKRGKMMRCIVSKSGVAR